LRATTLLEALGHAELDAARTQPVGQCEGEEVRHADALRVMRREEPLDDRRGRVADRVHHRPELARAVRVDVLDRRRAGLFAGPALLERIRQEYELAAALEHHE